MARNRTEEADYRALADEFGLDASEVRKMIGGFFGAIIKQSNELPFNNMRKIYKREKFDEFVVVQNIPSLGRIGPVYSRYLKWRENESTNFRQEQRSAYRERISQDEIEHIAEDVLSGRIPEMPRKKRGNELFNRIWLVGKNGKRQARQVIPKTENV